MIPIYSIYRAYCVVNRKSYVGFDSNWSDRQKDHKKDSKKSKFLFHKAIRKYGWESFEWTIIYQSYDRDHTLKVMEPFFIREYDSFMPNGYNMTMGGEGMFGFKPSIETLSKMSSSHKGLFVGEKNPMFGRTGILNPNYGKKPSEELIENLRNLQMGNKHAKGKRTEQQCSKISQNSSNTSNWLITFPDGSNQQIRNLQKFCAENNLDRSTMSAVAQGKAKQHKGFLCKKIS